jgi:hypothetical protein
MESKLINQGSYGCIYYPSLPFQSQRDKKHNNNRRKRRNIGSSAASTAASASSNNNEQQRSKYVSKLQKFNFHSDFEDHIGKKIQEIPSYDLFFVPVLKTYKIDLATIKEKHISNCDAISKYIKRNVFQNQPQEQNEHSHAITSQDYKQLNKHFIIQKMKYVNGIHLNKYLMAIGDDNTDENDSNIQNTAVLTKDNVFINGVMNDGSDSDGSDSDGSDSGDSDSGDSGDIDPNPNNPIASKSRLTKTLRKDERQIEKYRNQFKNDEKSTYSYNLLSIIFDLYERIIDSIQLLIKYKIVHYDLKENNILIETRHQLPYIIDFGLSIDVSRLQEHPWREKQEEHSKKTIHSDILYKSDSSKIFQFNYLWKQHFYVHAPDYFLWPIEAHIMTYLINENETLTNTALRKLCYTYVKNNKAIAYTSTYFKKRLFDMSVATFSRFIEQPRETVLNELLKYWDKWDIYAVNIMFLKTLYEILFHREIVAGREDDDDDDDDADADADADESKSVSLSLNEDIRQNILDPDSNHMEKNIQFRSKYKIKLKNKYNNKKIMNIIQVMLRNIHPNPDKRMTPEETTAFFVSIFYRC